MPDLKCTSVGCMAPVTHMESLATGIPKPWCCKHYESLTQLKREIAERQHRATVELVELQATFYRGILTKNGLLEP